MLRNFSKSYFVGFQKKKKKTAAFLDIAFGVTSHVTKTRHVAQTRHVSQTRHVTCHVTMQATVVSIDGHVT